MNRLLTQAPTSFYNQSLSPRPPKRPQALPIRLGQEFISSI